MYKILVLSDTHRKMDRVTALIDRITDLNHIIHLGDMVRDAEDLEAIYDIPIDYVAGNCDFNSLVRQRNVIKLRGKTFYLTHGHLHGVKWGYREIRQFAEENRYDVVLFGHTHIPLLEYVNDTIIMNPGSISEPRNSSKGTYGIIQIDHKAKLHAAFHEF